MQLTLDDLRKASDPLALLLGMSDSDLDRVAAEVQGWELDRIEFDDFHSCRKYRACWCYDKQPSGFGEYIERRKYKPTRKLSQSYHLELHCREQCNLYVRRIWGSGKFMYILTPLTEPGEAYDKDRAGVWESDAGSHARAVVVLAILGLLGKDGGA